MLYYHCKLQQSPIFKVVKFKHNNELKYIYKSVDLIYNSIFSKQVVKLIRNIQLLYKYNFHRDLTYDPNTQPLKTHYIIFFTF